MKKAMIVSLIALVAGLFIQSGKAIPTPVANFKNPAAAPSAFLIDEVGIDAELAVSYNRRLKEDYAGNIMRIRRSSDNAESDIGFDGDETDRDAMTTFTGANDAFVVTRYDMSGNANNLTQATAANQPMIISAGTILTGPNGKIIARNDGVNDHTAKSGMSINPATTRFVTFGVYNSVAFTSTDCYYGVRFSDPCIGVFNLRLQQISSSGNKLRLIDEANGTASGAIVDGTFYLIRTQWDSTAKILQINADAEVSNADSLSGETYTVLSVPDSALPANMEDAEFVVWYDNTFDATATTTAKANINAYYFP